MTDKSSAFSLPDHFHHSAIDIFFFSPSAREEADAILSREPAAIFTELLRDQEGEGALLAAKRILDATFDLPGDGARPAPPTEPPLDPEALARWVAEQRRAIAGDLDRVLSAGDDARRLVLRERAALSTLAGCWLDMVSQPATQPATVVNRLFAHHWRLMGEGNPTRAAAAVRRRAAERAGVFLPALADAAFARESGMSPATALHAAFLVALSRYPVNYLPELVGVHYACHALGVDDALAGTTAVVTEAEARAVLADHLRLAGSGPAAERTRRAVVAMVEMETRHAALLAALTDAEARRTLDDRMAAIIRRHARFAGKQHGRLRLGGRLLSEALDDAVHHPAEFLQAFKRSGYARTDAAGRCRFIEAVKFGGPMFGIFSEDEARIFKDWVAALPDTGQTPGEAPGGALERPADESPFTAGWLERIRKGVPRGVRFAAAPVLDDRSLLHRLVTIENHPHVLPVARARALTGLADARSLFRSGADGAFTDATAFPYSPEALNERVASIYWNKLVNPYTPMTEIPDRDEVVFGQKIFALGSLIDGSWAYRIGNAGRYERSADGMLFAIYADEMGHGDTRKNHITLIHQVLASLGIALPHIRDAAFIGQDEIPDAFYAFPLNQLCLGLFPDSLYPEILGYNLGIEMFGLGALRLHEIRKLTHWGFDPGYERAHLSIDNLSAGHARQSVDIIQSHLDHVERLLGPAVAQAEWQRVWNGYASFAYFAEGHSGTAKPLTDGKGIAEASDDEARVFL